MPAPLPESRRAEVMRRLEDGTTVTEVARQLGIGRQTVTRYRAAAREQQAAVPKPRSMGGYRSSKVKRAQIVQLSTLATENPKRTVVRARRSRWWDDTRQPLYDRALSAQEWTAQAPRAPRGSENEHTRAHSRRADRVPPCA
jgi:transposase